MVEKNGARKALNLGRHPEVRAKRASKGDGAMMPPSFEAWPSAKHLRMTD
jgi:hypothetical protein